MRLGGVGSLGEGKDLTLPRWPRSGGGADVAKLLAARSHQSQGTEMVPGFCPRDTDGSKHVLRC